MKLSNMISRRKKLLKGSLLVAFMLMCQLNYSNDTVILKNDKKRNVTSILIETVKEGSTLSIKDIYEQTLFTDKVDKTGIYAKSFDFSNLPDGEYKIEFEKQDEITIIPFTVENNLIVRSKKDIKIAKPTVEIKNDLVFVSHHSDQQNPMTIKIYYEGNDLAFSERIKDSENINRVYDFSTSKKGHYTILINYNNRTFRNHILVGN